ncbi:hypothetical protein SETIT_5G176300v2 [Setaria italica]|uniref:Uncharacterized protein n=1 Tax=Setaria italica TaxID=4555 RepID=A0A368R601_SETIT|nr:hypothetical protein SETIT_5G176300v2 [Setaria italica]
MDFDINMTSPVPLNLESLHMFDRMYQRALQHSTIPEPQPCKLGAPSRGALGICLQIACGHSGRETTGICSRKAPEEASAGYNERWRLEAGPGGGRRPTSLPTN